jgi:hypothetical protein
MALTPNSTTAFTTGPVKNSTEHQSGFPRITSCPIVVTSSSLKAVTHRSKLLRHSFLPILILEVLMAPSHVLRGQIHKGPQVPIAVNVVVFFPQQGRCNTGGDRA